MNPNPHGTGETLSPQPDESHAFNQGFRDGMRALLPVLEDLVADANRANKAIQFIDTRQAYSAIAEARNVLDRIDPGYEAAMADRA